MEEGAMPKDIYLQPDAPDPVLDAATVIALARRHIPDVRSVREVDETGGEARAYAVDEGVIVKTQRPHRLRARTSQEKEVCFLGQLARLPDLPVPRVLGYGREGGIEYTCLTRMPGIAVRRATLTGAARRAMLGDLGRVLRRIHGIPQGELVASGLFPGDRSPDDLRARLAEAFDDAVAAVRASPAAWGLAIGPDEVARRALAALPPSDVRVALHSNPAPEHTFVDPATGAYTGTIDFGDAYISHPALDLRRWRDPADREALFAGYVADAPVDDEFVAVWRVTQALADLTAIAAAPDLRTTAQEHLEGLLESW
jgi:hygromycin-B 7''-O-kinase